MKLIHAIVNNDDSNLTSAALTKEGFFVTKLATSGGFLKAGNTTFMVCTEDEKVETVISIIKNHCKKRTQIIPPSDTYGVNVYAALPVEVTVGGATVFVTNVEKYEKL